MGFNTIETRSRVSELNLVTEVSGRALTVRAGTFKMDGQEKALEQDEDFMVPDNAVSVSGYLVEDTENYNKVHVLVDTCAQGEDPFMFHTQTKYRLLEMLFWGTIPTTGPLEDVELHRRQIVFTPPIERN